MLVYLIYVCICVGVLLLWWLLFTTTRYYKLCRNIPGPTPYPVFGNVLQFVCRKEVTIDYFIKAVSKYVPITRLLFFNKCFVYLHDADHINKVLRSTRTISKGNFYEMVFRRFLGRSILSEPRDVWRKLRQIMNPTFNIHILKSFLGIFNEKCVICVDILKDRCDGSVVDIRHYLKMAALDMISQTSLGVNMRVQEENYTDVIQALEEGTKLSQTCLVNPFYWNEFIFNHAAIGRRAKKVKSVGEMFTRAIIEKKMMYYSENKEQLSDISENIVRDRKLGFLDYVLGVLNQKKEVLTTEELQAQVNILTAGGTDTTALTLSVCLMFLGLHKDVQNKVVDELRNIFGDDINRSAEYEDLQQMSYTEKVIKETMRLFPIAFVTTRRADEDIEIGGYIVPAGTDFVISQFMLHRNPKYFPDPLKFDPERFSPENCSTRHPHCYIPFLTGPRICIGYQYAMLQMKTMLFHILRMFEIFPCCTREQMEELEMTIFLNLKHGYNVRLKVRT